MKLSIIIPTNSTDLSIWPTVATCLEQNFDYSDFEILIVCNHKNTLLENHQKKLQRKNLKILCSQKTGVNFARNYGIQHALGEILYFLDDDCLLPNNNFVSQLTKAHSNHPGTCAIGSAYQSNEKTNYWGHRYNEMVNHWIDSHRHHSQRVLLPGGNCSFKKDLLGSHRFNPNIVYGGSETELLLRIQKHGLTVHYIDSLRVYHQSTPNLALVIRKAWLQGRGRSRYQTPKGKLHPPKSLSLQKILFLTSYRAIVDTAAITETLLNKFSPARKTQKFLH